MNIEVTYDFDGRYGPFFFGLEVTAEVFVTEDDADIQSWAVEGVRMPRSAMPSGLWDFMVQLAIEEWCEVSV